MSDPAHRADSGTPPGPPPLLPRSTLLWYSAPMAGFVIASMPISMMFGIFATDTLLISAAAMGTIVMLARFWDAISDPVAGYLSDNTRSQLGRRRSWMRASAIPMAVTLVALWTPPSAFDAAATVLWLGGFYILWETASTALLVPYAALGYELTTRYHERTRVFAWRHLANVPAYGAALGVVWFLQQATQESPEEGRAMATALATGAALILVALVMSAAAKLPEPARHQGRGAPSFARAVGDVFRNPHARVLLVVFAIEAFGIGMIGFIAPFLIKHVLGNEDALVPVLACWMIPQFLFTPLWLALSRRTGKRNLWIAGMLIYAVGFGANWWLAPGREWLVFTAVLVIGMGGGIAGVVAPSVQADVVDWDEHRTGERKEGSYTAVWNLLRKFGFGAAAGIGGLVMGASGYDGGLAEQSSDAKQAILVLGGLAPSLAYAFGALWFSRFSLNEVEHTALRAEIDARG